MTAEIKGLGWRFRTQDRRPPPGAAGSKTGAVGEGAAEDSTGGEGLPLSDYVT